MEKKAKEAKTRILQSRSKNVFKQAAKAEKNAHRRAADFWEDAARRA